MGPQDTGSGLYCRGTSFVLRIFRCKQPVVSPASMNILGLYTSVETKNKTQLYSKPTAFVSNIYEHSEYVT